MRFEYLMLESAFPTSKWKVNGFALTPPSWEILNEYGAEGWRLISDVVHNDQRSIVLQRIVETD